MEKEISQIFREIFKLAIYDQDTKAYYLSKIDYEILGLSNKIIRKKIVQKCDELNINLQYPNKPLPELKDTNLFEEYNKIQSKLKKNLSSEEKKELKKRRIELRNKIAQDNIELIKVIVNRRIHEIHNNINKEDAYQFGYLRLIKYIDSSYLDKDKMKYDINCELILYIENNLLHTKKNISIYQDEQVSKLKHTIDEEPHLTQSDLSRKMNLTESQIRTLTNLDNISSSISTNKMTELECDESSEEETYSDSSKEYPSYLYDDRFEERLIEQLEINEFIHLIIETLPKEKQNILNLYFGLNGYSRYNMPQIGKMYNMTRAGIFAIINDTLEMIRNSLRMKYLMEHLKDIHEADKSYGLEQSEKLNLALEEKLIRNLPTYIINKIMIHLDEEQKQFLQLYCEDENYSIKELAKKLNISDRQAYQTKNKILKTIRIILLEEINLTTYTHENYYYQYIKYLMNMYSNQIKIKKRR